ncbi:PAS domain S-box protein [Synechocystis salina LEGE 06155]|nr:PAS domain S-box protein [Synechocystis salina LEGE 06155]
MNDNQKSTFHLLTIHGESSPRNIILEKKQYSIGRNSNNEIVIRDLAISRNHCTIFPVHYKNLNDQDCLIFWIIDGDLSGNHSSNGLFVNGNSCYSHELKSGDIITFIGSRIYIQYTIAFSILDFEKLLEFSPSQNLAPSENVETSATTVISQETILKDLLDDIFRAMSHQGNNNQTSLMGSYCFLETNSDGDVVFCDGAFQHHFPLLIDNFSGHPFTKFLWDEMMEMEIKIVIRKVKYRRNYYTQYAHLDSDTQTIKSYILNFSDSNEFNRIRDSEEKYRAIFRQVSQGILLVDPQTLKIVEANPAYCNLMGYDAAHISQLTLPDLMPSDRQIFCQLIESLLTGRREIRRESLHRRQDGTFIEMEEEISLIVYSAHKVVCLAVKDITDQKQNQRQLQQSVREKEVLLKEIHHRVKNNLLVVSSLLDWRSESITEPVLRSVFSESQRRIGTIALIHEKLYGTKDLNEIDFGDYLETLAIQIFESFSINDANPERIKLEFDLNPVYLNVETAMPCGLIVNELLLNIFKHAFPDQRQGNVHFSFKTQSEDNYLLVIKDDGVGFPENFDFTETESLGWQLINLLTTQLDGTIKIKQGNGAEIELLFPRQEYHR